MNSIENLASERVLHINLMKRNKNPSLEEHRNVFLGLEMLFGKYFIMTCRLVYHTFGAIAVLSDCCCQTSSEEASRNYRWRGLTNQAIDNQHAASNQAIF